MLTITIDGNEVSLTGSRKGDGVYEALQRTAWKWSRPTGGFVLPRNLLPHTRDRNIEQAKTILARLGFEVQVEDTGAVLSVAEEREQERERLEARAERYEARAERREGEAAAAFETVDRISSSIPLGQPVLVDHYSGRRHLRDLAKMDGAMRRGIEASREARESARLADGIKRSLDDGTPTVTLRRRIERHETEIRDLNRRLDGTSVASGYGKPAEGEYRDRLLGMRQRAQEALDLDNAELSRRAEEEGVKVWTREDFQVGDQVLDRFGWHRVVRVNSKSLTVEGLSWRLGYERVKDRRRDGGEAH